MPEPASGEIEIAEYGSWRSPFSAALVASSGNSLSQIVVDGDDLYWIEMRPTEGGRNVIVRRDEHGNIGDVTPPPFNARTRVHEYGGGAFAVADHTVYFSNFADQRIYRQPSSGVPEPLTAEVEQRYADFALDATRRRLVCVREDHSDREREAVNAIVAIAIADGSQRALVAGGDFYSSPRLSRDHRQLAWLSWNHPNMPWDGCELWLGELDDDGMVASSRCIAGGHDEAIVQPDWSPDNVLYFVSDRSGWWNLYQWRHGAVEPLCSMEDDFGAPHWIFGLSTYAFLSAQSIVCAYTRNGRWRLATLATKTLEFRDIDTPYTELSFVRAQNGCAILIAASPTCPAALIRLDPETAATEVVRASSSLAIDAWTISTPWAIGFPTTDGLTAHAFFYAPKNPRYRAPDITRPPLIVISHGGPTSATSTSLNLKTQFWTSRGFAVLDVNYGGSSGYGRAYRQRLNGKWGVVDVDDCVNGALYLVEQGEADADKLIIRGASAGGFTTLSALAFRDVFKAGASYYGVSDLEALDQDTHKFESRYNATLIGPYPEQRARYRERSPIHATERLSCPLILLQGLEDKIVPPSQAEMMFDSLRKKGLPVAYLSFESEQHGFRRAENIRRALEAELYFYSKVFGFAPADALDPVPIANLEA